MHQEGRWKTERNVLENVRVWKKSDSMSWAKSMWECQDSHLDSWKKIH